MNEQQQTPNLNDLRIPSEDKPEPLQDFGGDLSESVTVYFRDIVFRLADEIRCADYVFGCVAWLSNALILDCLAEKKGACFVVQKEDFLRPDAGGGSAFDRWQSRKLRPLYDALPSMTRYEFPFLRQMCWKSPNETIGVRCVGHHNREKKRIRPNMHHKFAIFAKSAKVELVSHWKPGNSIAECPTCGKLSEVMSRDEEPCAVSVAPRHRQTHGYGVIAMCSKCGLWTSDWYCTKVWTGSFNWSENGVNSLENAVVISDCRVIDAYLAEFEQIAALSEPLDWQSEWVEPEWRIGS
jgi:hypothetical protein